MQVHAYATEGATEALKPFEITRRDLQPNDVLIDITHCGVCHSDIHAARNEWGRSKYPFVPGHEIIGRVSETGPDVTQHKVGDLVGVGCMVDACLACPACHDGDEQYCEKGMVGTYGGIEPVIGLGHMGIKFAVALGAEVVMITTSPEKGEDARRLGVSDVLVSKDRAQMKAHLGSFDFLLNTVPVKHDLNPYLGLLARNGTMVIVGAIAPLEEMHGGLLLANRRRIAGSGIGGLEETQDMLDFCAEHDITCDVEVIAMKDINEAYDRVVASDVKYRFVIDMATL